MLFGFFGVVTMQAQRVAPPELVKKDKFLIQSTMFPFLTAAEDTITHDIFYKESSNHIEYKKLNVFLISPSYSSILTKTNRDLKQDRDLETSSPRDKAWRGVENTPPPQRFDNSEKINISPDTRWPKSSEPPMY